MGQVTITLNGRAYRIGCGEGEEARLEELARYLTAKLDSLRATLGQIGEERLLVMAAILIADELFDARERPAEGGEAAQKRAQRRSRKEIVRIADPAEVEPVADVATVEPDLQAAS